MENFVYINGIPRFLKPLFAFVIYCVALQYAESRELLDTEDAMVVVDAEDTTEHMKLPSSHSAALAMAFIFLCVGAYGIYRVCRCRCRGPQPLVISFSESLKESKSPSPPDTLEDYIKKHEDYRKIYGPKRDAAIAAAAIAAAQRSS